MPTLEEVAAAAYATLKTKKKSKELSFLFVPDKAKPKENMPYVSIVETRKIAAARAEAKGIKTLKWGQRVEGRLVIHDGKLIFVAESSSVIKPEKLFVTQWKKLLEGSGSAAKKLSILLKKATFTTEADFASLDLAGLAAVTYDEEELAGDLDDIFKDDKSQVLAALPSLSSDLAALSASGPSGPSDVQLASIAEGLLTLDRSDFADTAGTKAPDAVREMLSSGGVMASKDLEVGSAATLRDIMNTGMSLVNQYQRLLESWSATLLTATRYMKELAGEQPDEDVPARYAYSYSLSEGFNTKCMSLKQEIEAQYDAMQNEFTRLGSD